MNNKVIIVIVAILLFAGLGYIMMNQSTNQTEQIPSTEDQQMAPTSQEFTVTLSEQNVSGESGTATFTEENGQVKVTLNLTGVPQEVTQPAHIHVGACPDVGEVKYPLTSPVNGVSETILDTTLDQIRSEYPLGLNIHKSTDEPGVYVSCGDLTF